MERWNEPKSQISKVAAPCATAHPQTAASAAGAPACSVRKARSRVNNRETFTTESRGKLGKRAGSGILPGASARSRFVVITAIIVVRVRLRLKACSYLGAQFRRF